MENIKVILMSGSRTGCWYAQFLSDKVGINLVRVITGTDSARGRGRKEKRAVVADFCDRTRLDVYQPEDINTSETLKMIKESGAQMVVVVDYGQILSGEILRAFTTGAFNIHYSLLPDLRGASPVRGALLKGYTQTGVTLMRMNEKIDRGGIVAQKKVDIMPDDNHEVLKERLTDRGIKLLDNFLDDLSRGKEIDIVSQSKDEKSSYVSKIDKSLCSLDWNLSAEEILNRIRAMAPSPGCFSYFKSNKSRIKLLGGKIYDSQSGSPGEITEVAKKYFVVSCLDKSITITVIQPAGKRAMAVSAYLAGNKINAGDRLIAAAPG
ncbi:MAG: methionyl-tRNA formyltransferase, partial [Elusimicrobia bacterium]|nr:methionyl-tRNA formyltransferase [Elusimicrobiota bacterium]